MRWKSVVLVGALGPVAMGCNIARNAARNVVNEPLVVRTKHVIHRDLRHEANATWREVRAQYPRRAFTAEFRDGFTDGYVDYLDRGGNGSIPAVPPSKYTRHARYFTEEGQCRVKDYFLGFKYGQEIAIATGKRQFLTVPVLLPQPDVGPPAFAIQPPLAVQPGVPLPQPTPLPTPPPAPTPVPTPQLLPQPEVRSEPPVAAPPAAAPPPVAYAPGSPSATQQPLGQAPAEPPPIAVPPVKLPAPPPEVPELPPHIPTPPVTDELPVIPPIHAEPPVVPPLHPEVPGK